MKTLEAAGRLARNLRGGDLTQLTMSELADVLEAMNAGLHTLYLHLPTRLRRSIVSVELEAPKTVTVAVTEGSPVLGGNSFAAGDIGRSVVIDGDPNWNEVTAINALMDSYLGATGSKSAVVYSDSCLDSSYPFDLIAGNPSLPDQRKELTHFNARSAGWSPKIGQPEFFWLEDMAAAIGGEPSFVLRVYPAPDRAYNLRVALNFLPQRLVLANLQAPITLNVPEQYYESAYLPICRGHLALNSPAWADPRAKGDAVGAASMAKALLERLPGLAGSPNNRVGTPFGY